MLPGPTFSQAVGQTWPPSSKGSVNPNQISPCVWSKAADVPGEIPVPGQQDPTPQGSCNIEGFGSVMSRREMGQWSWHVPLNFNQILSYDKDKMEVEYFYFYL